MHVVLVQQERHANNPTSSPSAMKASYAQVVLKPNALTIPAHKMVKYANQESIAVSSVSPKVELESLKNHNATRDTSAMSGALPQRQEDALLASHAQTLTTLIPLQLEIFVSFSTWIFFI